VEWDLVRQWEVEVSGAAPVRVAVSAPDRQADLDRSAAVQAASGDHLARVEVRLAVRQDRAAVRSAVAAVTVSVGADGGDKGL